MSRSLNIRLELQCFDKPTEQQTPCLVQNTDPETKSWRQQIELTLLFYQYSDLDVALLFDKAGIPKLDPEATKSELKIHPAMQSLFNAAG